MKKSVKGALLSGLVYPGLGHWALGKKGIGFCLMGATSLGIGVLIYEIGRLATEVIDRIGGAVDGDPQRVKELVESAAGSAWFGSGRYRAAVWFVVVCWVAGIVGAYRVGRRQDRHPVGSDRP